MNKNNVFLWLHPDDLCSYILYKSTPRVMFKGSRSIVCMDTVNVFGVGHVQYIHIFRLCKIISRMDSTIDSIQHRQPNFCSQTLEFTINYLQTLGFILYFMFFLVSTQVLESTIFVMATIDKSCDERLDVDKRFPSLVSQC